MRITSLLGLCAALAACGGGSSSTTDSGPDTGTVDASSGDTGTTDAGGDATTSDAAMTDGAIADGSTSDGATSDGSTSDGAIADGATSDAAADASVAACAGTECVGFPASLDRGCTLGAGGADVNCAAEMHQLDCCGNMRAMGVNHGIVGTTFCPAEATCRATYTTPAPCTPGPITVDTGDTTANPERIHVRCNIAGGATVGTCETYLGPATGGVGTCG